MALRRTRSLLVAGRSIFPPEELELLEALPAWMASITGPVRDLDVLPTDLPAADRPSRRPVAGRCGALVAELTDRRSGAFASLIATLDGNRYQVLLRRWQWMASVYRSAAARPGLTRRDVPAPWSTR